MYKSDNKTKFKPVTGRWLADSGDGVPLFEVEISMYDK